LLLQAEYRVPVWGPFDASVFADAGKVTHRPADLGLSGLKHDFGFSVSVMKGSATMARTDIGFGSGEGAKFSVSFGIGADFLP
jgi:outer membrane translocation and assembly module TamA